MSPLSFTHLNLDVRELNASERFYRDVMQLPVTRTETALRICAAEYLLVLNAGTPHVGGSFHFGFRVATQDDVDVWIERLREAGVPVLVEPHRSGTVYVGRVADPDAYEIEIYADLD